MARVTVALFAAVAIAGCGGGDNDKSTSKPARTTAKQTTATSPSGKPVATPEKAVASREGTVDHKPVTLEIVEIKRSGDTSVLNIRLTAKNPDDSAQVAATFDDGLFQKLKNTDDPTASADTLDGITLIDSKNRKRYLVGRDSNGACVCDSALGSAFAGADEPVVLSATYAAPPADVTSMSVAIPHFGTFEDVPVS